MPHFFKNKIPGQGDAGRQGIIAVFLPASLLEPWQGVGVVAVGITGRVGEREGGLGELIPLDMMAIPNPGNSLS